MNNKYEKWVESSECMSFGAYQMCMEYLGPAPPPPYSMPISVPFSQHHSLHPEGGGRFLLPKPLYHTAALQGITTHKTSTLIYTAMKTSNLASGTSLGKLQFTGSVFSKPLDSSKLSYWIPCLFYWVAETRVQFPTSLSSQISSRQRPWEGFSLPISPCFMSKFTPLGGSWMKFSSFIWGLTYGWLWSCPLLTGPWSTTLSPRKVLMFPWTTKWDSVSNSSSCI